MRPDPHGLGPTAWGPPWHHGGPWGPPRGLVRWGPLILAVFTVVGTLGALREAWRTGSGLDRGDVGLPVGLAAVAPLSLYGLARHPRAIGVIVLGVVLTYHARGYPPGPIYASAAIAVFVLALRGLRYWAWGLAATGVVAAVAIRTELREQSWSWLVLGVLTAWMMLALTVAELARARAERFRSLRRERTERLTRQAGEERLRIAQELHDTVAHHMALINMQAAVALHLADRRPEQATTALTAIRDASKEGLTELRALVEMLRNEGGAAPRSPTATLAALPELSERARTAGLRVTVDPPTPQRDPATLPVAVDIAAYRIIQESVTNVVRHAHARRVAIQLAQEAGQLVIRVDDDGVGATADWDTAGSGITGMRERAVALGGTLHIGPSPLGGFQVTARLPLPEEDAP